MNSAWLLFGTNLGDRLKILSAARDEVEQKVGEIIASSSVYETQPWGLTSGVDFLNQVIQVKTRLSPEELLRTTLLIEKAHGRTRGNNGYESRTLDIDILFFNESVIKSDNLVIPHPRMQDRRFVLVPLAEIVPGMVHPVFGKNVSQLLEECSDQSYVRKIELHL